MPESAPLGEVWRAAVLRRSIDLERQREEAVTGFLLNRDLFKPLTYEQLTAHLYPPQVRKAREAAEEEADALNRESEMLARFRAYRGLSDE